MIKIQEHLDISKPNAFLKNLAEKLWDDLNPLLADLSDYKKSSLVKKCNLLIEKTKEGQYIAEYANNVKSSALRHRRFLNYLTKNDSAILKSIITATPKNLENLREDILGILREEDLFYIENGRVKQTAFGSLLSEKIFNYKQFRNSIYCLDLFTKLKFSSVTCPYCNYNKLQIVNINLVPTAENKRKAYLDLDHFYSKSRSPFFAVSFFNLIPSCHSCNASDKGDKIFTIKTHVHPYTESFDDLYTFGISTLNLLGISVNQITLNSNGKKKADRTLDDLMLEQRFQDKLVEVQNLTSYYQKYKGYMKTADAAFFLDTFFVVKQVPKLKKQILSISGGKLVRDILKDIDKPNNYLDLD